MKHIKLYLLCLKKISFYITSIIPQTCLVLLRDMDIYLWAYHYEWRNYVSASYNVSKLCPGLVSRIVTRVKITVIGDLNIVINIVIIVNIIRTNTIQIIALNAYK